MSTLSVTNIKSVSTSTDLSISTGNTTGGSTLLVKTGGYTTIRSNRSSGVGTPSYGEGALEVAGIGEEIPYIASIAYGATTTDEAAEFSLLKARGTYSAGTPTMSATIDGDVLGSIVSYPRNSTGWITGAQIQFIQTGDIAANGKANGSITLSVSDSTSILKTMFTVNTTAVSVSSTNTFNLGTSSVAASGYTFLPNGLKMNWGTCSPNSIGSNTVTFSSAFTTNAYGLSLTVLGTSATSGANARHAFVTTVTNTGITVITANSTANTNVGVTSVYYTAIGV